MALTARMVTIDCAKPAAPGNRGSHGMAFWTEAAGYEIQADNDGLVRVAGQG